MAGLLNIHQYKFYPSASWLLLKALLVEQKNSAGPFLFTIASVMLGIAIVIGVEIANQSALSEFERANHLISGTATHQVVGDHIGLDENIYTKIKLNAEIRNSTPVVHAEVLIHGEEGRYQLLGIDPFSDFRVRGQRMINFGRGDLADHAWPIYVPNLQQWSIGTQLTLQFQSRTQKFIVAGSISEESHDISNFDGLLVTDIMWAQELLNMTGKISHIALKLQNDSEFDAILEVLSPASRIIDLDTRNIAQKDMSRSFRTNLEALSLLSFLVALFLIYSSVSFQIARRRLLLSQFRAVGFRAFEIVRILCVELGIIALIGSIAGVLLGIFLAHGILNLVTATMDTHYYELDSSSLHITPGVILFSVALGFAGTALAGAVPLWDASRSTIYQISKRSTEEISIRNIFRWILPISAISVLLGAALLQLSETSLSIAFTGILFLIVGLTSCTPWLISKICRLLATISGRVFGLSIKLAITNIYSHLGRTGVAVIALSLAVCTSLGVVVMIDSFRFSVERWAENYLRSDLYITSAVAGTPYLPEKFQADLKQLEGIASVGFSRRITLYTELGIHELLAIKTNLEGFKAFMLKSPQNAELWRQFNQPNSVLVSEPFANHHNLEVGSQVVLPTNSGNKSFQIIGIYYDYTNEQGLVTMAWQNYVRNFSDHRVRVAAVFLKPHASVAELTESIRKLESAPSQLFIRSNRDLRDITLEIFDKTFEVTAVLRWLTMTVAIAGLIFALATLQLERKRLNAILRAIGFTRLQLALTMVAECSLTGLLVGLIAIPIGLILALTLIDVINVRSFGWSISKQVDPWLMIHAVCMSVGAAIVSVFYPVFRMWKTPIQMK